MREERAAATAATMAMRQVVSISIFALILLLSRFGRAEIWRPYVLPTAVHAGLSVLTVFVRNEQWMVRLAPAAATADVLAVLCSQLIALPYATNPVSVVSFTLGLFAMVIAANGLTMRTDVMVTATMVAVIAEVVLMRAVEMRYGSMAFGIVVLTAVSVSTYSLVYRMRDIMGRFAAAEIAREVETRHSADVETARRTIERMLGESRARTDELERLQKDKELLTQLLVHDLRAPISVVMGYVDLVRTQLEPAPAATTMCVALDQALSTGRRLDAMINELLQISRLEDGELKLQRTFIDPHEFADDLGREASALVQEKRIELRVAVGAGAGDRIEADPELLRRVAVNLVSNAARFTPRGKRLHVSIGGTADELEIVVQNDGAPISAEVRGRLFEKYAHGSGDRRSQGLGLYFCRLVAEAHGGRIGVEDRGNFATSFVVRLPRAASTPPTVQAQLAIM